MELMSNEDLIKRAERALLAQWHSAPYLQGIIAELVKALKQAETTHTRILDCR